MDQKTVTFLAYCLRQALDYTIRPAFMLSRLLRNTWRDCSLSLVSRFRSRITLRSLSAAVPRSTRHRISRGLIWRSWPPTLSSCAMTLNSG